MSSPLPRERVLGLKSPMATLTTHFMPGASPSITGDTLRGRATSGAARLWDLYNTYAKHQTFTGAADAPPVAPVQRFEVRNEHLINPGPKSSLLETAWRDFVATVRNPTTWVDLAQTFSILVAVFIVCLVGMAAGMHPEPAQRMTTPGSRFICWLFMTIGWIVLLPTLAIVPLLLIAHGIIKLFRRARGSDGPNILWVPAVLLWFPHKWLLSCMWVFEPKENRRKRGARENRAEQSAPAGSQAQQQNGTFHNAAGQAESDVELNIINPRTPCPSYKGYRLSHEFAPSPPPWAP